MGKDNANLLFFEDKVIVILAEIESALFGRVGKGVASHLPDIPFLFWSSNFHFKVCWEQVSPFSSGLGFRRFFGMFLAFNYLH